MLLLRGLAWVAMAAYAARLFWDLGGVTQFQQQMRWVWAAGGVALGLHILLAFHRVHHWSHADAWQETARRSKELTGLDWGGGVVLNELTLTLWLADAAWWFAAPKVYEQRPAWVGGVLHLYLGFMAFNGAIVFGASPARWIALAVFIGLILGALVIRSRRRNASSLN